MDQSVNLPKRKSVIAQDDDDDDDGTYLGQLFPVLLYLLAVVFSPTVS